MILLVLCDKEKNICH